MYNPTREQSRRFMIEAWRKHVARLPASSLEIVAADVIAMHPEYHALLASDDAIEREWTPEQGQTNPFLHLSMHLAIEEQLAIDQPPGLRAAFETLRTRTDRHTALHAVLDALGEIMWRAQRDNAPMDAAAYVEAVRCAVPPRL